MCTHGWDLIAKVPEIMSEDYKTMREDYEWLWDYKQRNVEVSNLV